MSDPSGTKELSRKKIYKIKSKLYEPDEPDRPKLLHMNSKMDKEDISGPEMLGLQRPEIDVVVSIKKLKVQLKTNLT